MRNNLPFNAIISLFSEKRCYNPVTEWNNFDFWRKWQAAVSEKTKKRRPKSPFFEKDCKRQPIRRFLGMRIVRRMASSVSSRRAKKKTVTDRVLALYGSADERYW